jgi:hypothetical protein
MNYGIEYEFFVLNKDNTIIPAYLATHNLDGNPVVGEVKTSVHNNIVDCIFELKKILYREKEALLKLNCTMSPLHTIIVNDEFLKNNRKQKEFINRKHIEVLEEFSIYPKGKLGKMLKREMFKSSLQINFSNNKDFQYPVYTRVTVEDKSRYDISNSNKNYSSLFNYVDLILKLDNAFSTEIKQSDRVEGVYAIKSGDLGDRIEYRSLPSTVDLNKIIEVLK